MIEVKKNGKLSKAKKQIIEDLLNERIRIRIAEQQLEKDKKENAERIMEFMNRSNLEKIFTEKITVNIQTRTTTSIKEDLLKKNLTQVGLNEEVINKVMDGSKVTSQSKPFLSFKYNLE